MTTAINTHMSPGPTPAQRRSGGGSGRGRTGRARRLLLNCAFFVAILAVWSIARLADVMSTDALPAPWLVAQRLIEDVQTADYWTTMFDTLRSAVGGLVAAAVVGIPIGLVTGTYPLAERSSRVLVEFGRSFPVIAILPVMLLIMGTSFTMKGVVVFLACVFPLIIQAQYGAQSVSESVDETVRSYRIGRMLRFRKVVLPAASPSVWTGLRIASTMAILVAIGVEILTTVPGIGHVIVNSQQDQNAANAYAYIFTAGLLGFTVTRCVQMAEARALAWRPPTNSED